MTSRSLSGRCWTALGVLLAVLPACSAEGDGEGAGSSAEVHLVEILDRTTPDGVRLVLSEGAVESRTNCAEPSGFCVEEGQGVQLEVFFDGEARGPVGRLEADHDDSGGVWEVFDFGFSEPPGSSIGQPIGESTVSEEDLVRPYSVLVLAVPEEFVEVRSVRDGEVIDEMSTTGGFVAFAAEGHPSYELVQDDGTSVPWPTP